MKSGIVRALQSFVAGLGKDIHYVTEGDLYAADDALVAKYPSLFGPALVRESSPRVEQAAVQKRGA